MRMLQNLKQMHRAAAISNEHFIVTNGTDPDLAQYFSFGSEKLVIEDIVIERTGEHVGVVNVPMERVRIPCGGKLQAGDMLRGPVRNRA